MPETCPCGSGNNYDNCCGEYHSGRSDAPTAESLMRARYSAFVKQEIDYLARTCHPSHAADFDPAAAAKWASESEWLGLEILATDKGGKDDRTGRVEFAATYIVDDEKMRHHEFATFRKEEEKWYFLEGRVSGGGPYVRLEPKTGRNDPCSCGSGKKFKKCCGR